MMKAIHVRGGSKIYPYWITVFAVSAPFIYFLTRNAERLKIGKQEMLITTSLLCVFSLLFPWFLQQERVSIWIVSVIGILILPFGIPRVKAKSKNRTVMLEDEPYKIATFETACASIEEEREEVNKPEAEEDEREEVNEPEVEEVDEREMVLEEPHANFSLEESIEKGFQAKEEGQFKLAAHWFISSLERKPQPDLAFYLIIDSFGLLSQVYPIENVHNKLMPYITEFYKDAPPEWCKMLREWMEEKLPN